MLQFYVEHAIKAVQVFLSFNAQLAYTCSLWQFYPTCMSGFRSDYRQRLNLDCHVSEIHPLSWYNTLNKLAIWQGTYIES